MVGEYERARASVLRLAYAGHGSSGVCVPDGQEGTYQLTVLPPGTTTAVRPRDVVLLLDRSGSMDGWKMVAARRAAARIVDTLTAVDRFAVLTFDNSVERPTGLPAGLAPATDRHRYRAVEHLARVEARGGTEMLKPLTEALGLLTDAGRDRVLVLVTDGQVGNEDQILSTSEQFVRAFERSGRRARVFGYGVGSSVNRYLIDGLSRAGKGLSVYAGPREDPALT